MKIRVVALLLAMHVCAPSGLAAQEAPPRAAVEARAAIEAHAPGEDSRAAEDSRAEQLAKADGLSAQYTQLYDGGDYQAAAPLAQEALAIREKWLGPDHPDTLTAVANLADIFYSQGRYEEAEPLYLRALAGRERVLGPDHPDTLTSVNNLAGLLRSQGRYDEAEPLYKRALAGRERVLGPDHPDTLESVSNLAALFYSQGQYGEAASLYQRALTGRERVLGPDHPKTLLSVNNLALLFHSQGRYREAEPLYTRALVGRERVLGPDHPNTLTAVNNLATLFYSQGRYGEAELLYKRALAGRERVLGPEHPSTLTSANNLAGLFRAQGRYDEAEPLYKRALAAKERVLGPEHPDTLVSVHSLATLFKLQGRYSEAELLYKRAVEGSERAIGPDHPYTLISVNALADLFIEQGRYDEAEPLYTRALAGRERVLGPEHPDTLTSVNNLADLFYSQGRYERAERLYLRALAGRLAVLSDNNPSLVSSYEGIAKLIEAQQGDQAKAVYLRKRAVNALQSVRQNMADLDQETQRSFLKKHRSTYIALQEAFVTQGRFAEAEQVGRMLKEVEYTAFVRGATDAAPGEQLAMTRQERAWNAQLTQWRTTPNEIAGQLAILRSKERDEGALSALEQKQFADLDDAYGQAYEEFFTLVTQWTSDTQSFDSATIEREVEDLELEKSRALRRMLRDIGPDVALLQAVAFEDGLHLFLITGDAFVHEEVKVTRDELFETIFEARQRIDEGRDPDIASSEHRAKELHEPLGQLYQWLIAPIEDELASARTKTLMLNLQGQIRYLPFAALWDGEAYLTQKLQLALYTPAANTRYNEPAPLSRAQGFGLSRAVSGFSPLPGVPLEMEYVFGTPAKPGVFEGEYLLDEGFTRASFEAGLSSPQPVVHLATHFQIRPGDEAASFLLLGDGSRVSIAAINRSYKYSFEGVELLTLSACETALGAEATGMEIEGFGALAQNKGAASVMASLWQVSDAAAPEFMQSFYRGIVAGNLSKAGALQRTQSAMIQSETFKDPFYWAPFVIMGNWR